MPILNYTTKIDCYKTLTEIQKILSAHGANKIVVDNENGQPASLTFCINWNGTLTAFNLPCNWNGVLKAMQNDRKVPRSSCNKEQALRTGWRIVKDWVEAQIAIVEAQMATMQEVFLPYAVTNNGETLYKHIEGNKQILL